MRLTGQGVENGYEQASGITDQRHSQAMRIALLSQPLLELVEAMRILVRAMERIHLEM